MNKTSYNLAVIALSELSVSGGATLDIWTGELLKPVKGYGLSPYKDHERCASGINPLTRELIINFIKTNSHLLVQPNHALGLWINPKDGFIYIDVSVWVEDLAEATRLGKAAKQLALWDCAAGKEIFI